MQTKREWRENMSHWLIEKKKHQCTMQWWDYESVYLFCGYAQASKIRLLMVRFALCFVCLFGWLVSYRPRQQLGFIADGPQGRASDNFKCCHTCDHDFCLSWSHYTDTDPTSREPAATAGIEPEFSSPGVTRSTDWAPPPPPPPPPALHCLTKDRLQIPVEA